LVVFAIVVWFHFLSWLPSQGVNPTFSFARLTSRGINDHPFSDLDPLLLEL